MFLKQKILSMDIVWRLRYEISGFVDGTNYTELKKLVAAANRMQEASYPLGVTGGKYSPENGKLS